MTRELDIEPVLAVILSGGGRVAFSCSFGDDRSLRQNAARTCSGCGGKDHDLQRCRGPGMAPRPKAPRRRK